MEPSVNEASLSAEGSRAERERGWNWRSMSSSITAGAHLLESQIGGNYLFQMEDLILEAGRNDTNAAQSTPASSRTTAELLQWSEASSASRTSALALASGASAAAWRSLDRVASAGMAERSAPHVSASATTDDSRSALLDEATSSSNLAPQTPQSLSDEHAESLSSVTAAPQETFSERLSDEDNENGKHFADAQTPEKGAQKRQRSMRLPTMVVFTVVIFMCVLVVSAAGFLPVYTNAYTEVVTVFDALQKHATSGMVAASAKPLQKLVQMASIAIVQCATVDIDGTARFPFSPERAMVSLASILARPGYRGAVSTFQFVDTTPGAEWRVSVTSPFENSSLVGAIQSRTHSPDTTELYHLHPHTFLPAHKQPYKTLETTLDDAIYGVDSAYQRVVVGWNATFNRTGNYPLRTHWMIKSPKYGIHTSFHLVVPVRTSTGTIGYLETIARASSVMRRMNNDLIHALGGTGRYFIIDPVTEVLISNTWNQSTNFRGGARRYSSHVHAKDVTDPLAAAALKELYRVGMLGGPDTRSDSVGSHLRMKLRYGRDTAWIHAYSYKGTRAVDLNVVFVVVSLESDHLTFVYKTRTFVLCVWAIFTALILLGSYCLTSYVVHSLNTLMPVLKSSKTLQFLSRDAAAVTNGELSYFTELAYVQLAYARLHQQLMEVKTILPGPLLVFTGDMESSSNLGTVASGSSQNTTPERSGMAPSEDRVSTRTGGRSSSGRRSGEAQSSGTTVLDISRKWRQKMRLNTVIFGEQVNVFQRRYCTMLMVNRYYTQGVNDSALDRFLSACYTAAVEFNGCVEFLRPDYAVATFGAHTQTAMHATRACQCALRIYNTLPPEDRKTVNLFVVSSEFLVGTCGATHGKKGRVVFDVVHVLNLLHVCRLRGHLGVIATLSTASHLTDYISIPIDVVVEESLCTPFVLCEIREPPKHGGDKAQLQTAKRFREAFHYMTLGKYSRALRVYRSIGSGDPTAVKLAQLCSQHIEKGDTEGLMTVFMQPQMRLLGRILADKYLISYLRMQETYLLPIDSSSGNGDADPLHNNLLDSGGFVSPGSPAPLTNTMARDEDLPTRTTTARSRDRGSNGSSIVTRSKSSILLSDLDHDQMRLGASPTASSARGEGHSRYSRLGIGSRRGSGRLHPGDAGDALFEWIDVGSATSSMASGATTARGGANPTTSSVAVASLTFVDDNGRQWSRSVKPIGDGAFSVVYLGMSEDGVQVAIKCIPRRRRDMMEVSVRDEMRTISELQHPNIVRYVGFCVTQAYLSIIMEYVPGGSLYAYMRNFGRLDIPVARRFILDILSGLAYLHARNIVHCDVKPHNVLLGMDGVCKLSDFGSTISEATDLAGLDSGLHLRGTAVYMAPEVARGERCTPESDIYSLGISLLYMLLGRLPWRWSSTAPSKTTRVPLQVLYHNDVRFVQLLSRGDITPHIPHSLGRSVYSFCQACCQPDPADRPTAQELMNFPFIL